MLLDDDDGDGDDDDDDYDDAIASLGKQPVPSTTCEPSKGWVRQSRNRS